MAVGTERHNLSKPFSWLSLTSMLSKPSGYRRRLVEIIPFVEALRLSMANGTEPGARLSTPRR
jgi:hypothetical protein